MQRFGGIIFDMDGLLLDSERIALDAFNCACGEFGLGDQQAVFMRCVGTNRQRGEQIIRAGLAGQVDLAAFIASWDTQYAARTVGVAIPVKAGAVALLQAINKLGTSALVFFVEVFIDNAGKQRHACPSHLLRGSTGITV